MKLTGVFASVPEDIKEYREFILERRGKEYFLISSEVIEKLAYLIIFGQLHPNWDCYWCRGGNSDCDQKTSTFCKLKKAKNLFSDGYTNPNFLVIYRRFGDLLKSKKSQLILITGEYRYNSFMEYISINADEEYQRYTKREIKENNIVKPEVFESNFSGLDDIENDYWQKYLYDKIKKGESKCLHYLDLDLLGS